MKIRFNNYSEMPIKTKEKPNEWFNSYIKNLCSIEIDKDYVVKLNNNNSYVIENEIKNNPSYNASFANKIYDYYKVLNQGIFPKTNDKARIPITDLVKMIDLENSTNMWRYKNNRIHLTNMIDYIINPSTKFWDRLNSGDIHLVDDLKSASKVATAGPKSLASKICKYFSEIFFNKDNYYINDRVVRHVLPYYLEYYGVIKTKYTKSYFDNLSYKDLHYYMELLKNKANDNLTKNEIDHIMWYCYRYESIKIFDKF